MPRPQKQQMLEVIAPSRTLGTKGGNTLPELSDPWSRKRDCLPGGCGTQPLTACPFSLPTPADAPTSGGHQEARG